MHEVQLPTSFSSLQDFPGLDLFKLLDVKPYQNCRLQSSAAPTPFRHQHTERKRVVIFDKDGTLVCIHAMWAPWIRGLASRIEASSGLVMAEKIYAKISFDDNTGEIKPGLLGEGTMREIRDTLAHLLIEEGISREKAEHVMRECWQVRELNSYGDIQTVGDVEHLFRVLKANGYLIAINTSDSRKVTEKTLEHLNLRHLVDVVVCGDDEDILPKPHPSTARKICTKLNVQPRDAVMIGDSTTDMKLGSNAGLGCAIGVLTGVAPREVLDAHADYVVEDIHHAVAIILEDSAS